MILKVSIITACVKFREGKLSESHKEILSLVLIKTVVQHDNNKSNELASSDGTATLQP